MLTLTQIQTEAYATAREKGWHDKPLREPLTVQGVAVAPFTLPLAEGITAIISPPLKTNHDRVLAKHALIHTELTEAAECLEQGDLALREINDKPEGYVVEIADAIIRVCDTTAALGLTLQVPDSWLVSDSVMDVDMAAHWLAKARRYIDRATEAARVDDWSRYTNALTIVVVILADTCAGLKLDLGAAIEAKMRYNKTRPHRHGGKQA